jgi:KinB signaling pathway activation protein
LDFCVTGWYNGERFAKKALLHSGGSILTLRKWNYLFLTTLLIGTVAGMIGGAIVKLFIPEFVFLGIDVGGYEWIFMLLGMSTVAVLSHMGFFAYLIVRYVALSIFRGKIIYWNIIQVICILIALFDLFDLRYTLSENREENLVHYILLPIIILAVSLLVAIRKRKVTNRSAFLPTFFFMSVVTVLEAIPAFNLDDAIYTMLMILPLLACNAWQILQLHKLVPKSEPAKQKPAANAG